MREYKILLLLFSFLISYSYSIEQFIFTIKQFHLRFYSCMETYGTYTFFLDGIFQGSPSDTDLLTIDLDQPAGAKAECMPFSRYDYFECEIDICLYPLNSSDIYLPIKIPISNKYKIENWEEVISKEPGISNNVTENVTCIPNIQNIFAPSSIESKGCSGKKNKFSIKGDWEWGDNIPYSDFDFKIEIDNKNNDIAECSMSSSDVREFNCEFEGEGDIKFDDTFFKGYFTTFKMKKANVSAHVVKCEDNSSNSFLRFNIFIFIFIFVLLF